MNEEFREENPSAPAQAEQDVVSLIKNMQQRLISLEKKLDILINQSQATSSKDKYFPKSNRPFDRSRSGFGRERDYGSAGKSFDRGRRFEKRPGEESGGFGYKKKSYDNSREGGPSREHHFEKRHGDENRGFNQKKRPFFQKRRDRG